MSKYYETYDVCSFVGYDFEQIKVSRIKLYYLIKKQIKAAIKKGYRIFNIALTGNIDLFAAEVVMFECFKNINISLICYCEYKGFEKNFPYFKRKRYENILKNAAWVSCPFSEKSKDNLSIIYENMFAESSLILNVFEENKIVDEVLKNNKELKIKKINIL